MNDNILKCKFCAWTTKKWTTRKGDKKRVHGNERLINHVMMQHPEEFEKINEWLDTWESEVTGG